MDSLWMAIFNSFLYVYQRVPMWRIDWHTEKNGLRGPIEVVSETAPSAFSGVANVDGGEYTEKMKFK